jgi:hypothetical protein
MRSRLITIFCVLAAICLGPWQAGATPQYTAFEGIGGDNTLYQGSTPQTAMFSSSGGGFAWQLNGSAGAVLGASSHLIYSNTVSGPVGFGGAIGPAYGQFLLTDVIISGPPGTLPGTLVNTSFNLSIKGNLAASFSLSGPGNIDVSSGVNISGSIGPPLSGGFGFVGGMTADSSITSSGPATTSFTATGILSAFNGVGFPGTGLVNSGSGDLPVGTPLNLVLKLSAQSSVSGSPASPTSPAITVVGESTADFFHTLGFPTSGPVFNLPAGYTVNSVSGKILNNHFIRGAPIPSTMLLLLD